MTEPKHDSTSKPLGERVRELLQGWLDAGDELAASVFGPPKLQPAMIPLRRPRR